MKSAQAYVDDIMIISDSKTEHVGHLKTVIKKSRKLVSRLTKKNANGINVR